MAKAFNLTPRAREDLRAIWRYTAEIWNETQADAYVTKLHERFGWLAKRPRIGKHRPDIGEGYYCFPEAQKLFAALSDLLEAPNDRIMLAHIRDPCTRRYGRTVRTVPLQAALQVCL